MGRSSLALGWIAAICAFGAAGAEATTLTFSNASSDNTPAALLSATLSYALTAPDTLQISVRNDTPATAPFDITLIFFNTGPQLSYYQLLAAQSSIDGDNTAAWRLGYYGYDLATAMFGNFDFSLRTEPTAPAKNRIQPGETQSFTLAVSCRDYVGCTDSLLDGWSEGGRISASAALRFDYGPGGDAAFGAYTQNFVVPEPAPAALLALGLGLLSAARARRRA